MGKVGMTYQNVRQADDAGENDEGTGPDRKRTREKNIHVQGNTANAHDPDPRIAHQFVLRHSHYIISC